MVLSRGRISLDNIPIAKTIHALLDVLDEIALHSRESAIDEMLITLLVEKEETFKFFKHYAGQILLNTELEKEIIKFSQDGKVLIKKYRIRIVKHYQVNRTWIDTVS
jgi:hypothetical protein